MIADDPSKLCVLARAVCGGHGGSVMQLTVDDLPNLLHMRGDHGCGSDGPRSDSAVLMMGCEWGEGAASAWHDIWRYQ